MYPPPPPLPHQPRSMPYKILCVANLNSKVSDGSIRDALIREFTRFGDVSVKVTHDANERFAYIYFRCYEDAREARHAKSRMILFDKAVEIDPIYERSVVSFSSSSASRSRRSLTPDYGLSHPPLLTSSSSHSSSRRPVSPASGSHSRARGYPPSSSSSSARLVDRHGVPYATSSSSRHPEYVRDHHHNHHPLPRDDYPPVRSSSSSNHQHNISAATGNSIHSSSNSNNNGTGREGSGSGSSNRDKNQRDAKKEKFPNYLHHIPPEEDDKATRTLFVGNLEVSISEPDLKRIFERYGTVEDIDVKRPPPGQGNAYAFIKYQNLDMAHRSKVEMSGQYIGKFQCKIGYGKATPTTRIWVGGLGSWTSLSALEREFDRFGAIRKIDFVRGDNHAYISYDSIDAAQAACQEMRGFPLGGQDKRLRVDFADPGPYNSFDGTPPPTSATSPSAGDPVNSSSATRVVLPGEKFADTESGSGLRPLSDQRFVQTDSESEGRHDRSSHPSSGLSDPSPDAAGSGDVRPDRSNGNNNNNSSAVGSCPGLDPDRRDSRKSRSIHSPDNQPPPKRLRDTDVTAAGRTCGLPGDNGVRGETVNDARSILVSDSVTCLTELVKCCPSAWTGALILKNSAFATKMLLCSGDVSLVDLLMKTTDHPPPHQQQRHPSSSPPCSSEGSAVPLLRITQRLRLDPSKLDDVSRRMSAAGSQGHCMLLATRAANCAHFSAGSSSKILGEDGNEVVQRPLKNLVHYLKQKQAAGVIPLTSSTHPSSASTTSASPAGPAAAATTTTSAKDVRGSLYAFPPCPFAFDLIHKIAPNFVDSESSKEEYLLIVVIRGSK